MSAPAWNDDFEELLLAFEQTGVEFVVVGAHAMAVQGVPRATGDLDVRVRPSPDNARRVVAALEAFRAPIQAHGITADDFCEPGTVDPMGLPPRRIDVLTSITGVDFDTAWSTRVLAGPNGRRPFLRRAALLANKRATARPKDLADIALLEATGE